MLDWRLMQLLSSCFHSFPQHALSSYHEVSVGRQQSWPVSAVQSSHGAVVRVCGADEVVHFSVAARHTRRRPYRVTPQDVDGIVQTLQAVLDTTLLQSERTQTKVRDLLSHFLSYLRPYTLNKHPTTPTVLGKSSWSLCFTRSFTEMMLYLF